MVSLKFAWYIAALPNLENGSISQVCAIVVNMWHVGFVGSTTHCKIDTYSVFNIISLENVCVYNLYVLLTLQSLPKMIIPITVHTANICGNANL